MVNPDDIANAITDETVMGILEKEIGSVFIHVLEDAGVYKWQPGTIKENRQPTSPERKPEMAHAPRWPNVSARASSALAR